MRAKDPFGLTICVFVIFYFSSVDGLGGHKDQAQHVSEIHGDMNKYEIFEKDIARGERVKRAEKPEEVIDNKISSVFHLNNSHLHLMVHWAGKGSSIVFCLARDQVCRVI